MGGSALADVPEALDVLVVGAGFSGICAGIKLREQGIRRFVIVDKGSGIGGTWWENTYPGAACDIPSHLYAFSFEPNPNWSAMFAQQPEIQTYLEHCVTKYDLGSHIRFGMELEALTFNDATALWRASFADGSELWARHVISGTGGLHRPFVPEFVGSFAGPSMHTAQWQRDFDHAGKRIAVIGTAASAVQVIPELAKTAAHIVVMQRTANWVAPRNDFAFSDRQKRWFKRLPVVQRLFRLAIFLRLDLGLYPIVVNPRARARRADDVAKYLRSAVTDPQQQRALAPQYELGCRRILISDDYYAALSRDHVELVTTPIDRFDDNAVVTSDGQRREVDAVVYATGFDIQGQFSAVEVTGRGGVRLADVWSEAAAAYRGVMVPEFPNFFMTTGPNTGVGTTSVVFMIETTVRWIVAAITATGPHRTVAPTQPAFAAFNAQIQAALSETVWATDCTSWYKRPDGVIETLYPYNARTFRRSMRRVKWTDLVLDTAPPYVSVGAAAKR